MTARKAEHVKEGQNTTTPQGCPRISFDAYSFGSFPRRFSPPMGKDLVECKDKARLRMPSHLQKLHSKPDSELTFSGLQPLGTNLKTIITQFYIDEMILKPFFP